MQVDGALVSSIAHHASRTNLLVACIRAENKLVAEEVDGAGDNDAGIVAGLECADKNGAGSNGMRVLIDRFGGVEGVRRGVAREDGDHKGVRGVGCDANAAEENRLATLLANNQRCVNELPR